MFRERIDSNDRLQSRNRFLFNTIFPTMLLTLVLTFYVFSTELLFTINSSSTTTDVTVEPSFPTPFPPPSTSPYTSTFSSDEKFLTYLPHSGFHNQHISLLNAIMLSYLTNRTLIIPPILINHKIHYDSFNKLYKVLNQTVSIKRYRMYHCDEDNKIRAETCNKSYSKYDNFTMMNWEDIINLSKVEKYIKILNRGYDFSLEKLNENFNVTDQETYLSIEEKRYQFKFYDNDKSKKGLDEFKERIFISDLLKIDKKLLHFSSLFSSYRIVLENEKNIQFHHMIHKSLMINNHRILDLSNIIINKLGGNGTYFGLHIRVGDKLFKNQEQIALNHIRNNLTDTFSKLGLNKKKIDTNKLKVCLKKDLPIIYVATDSKDPKKEFKELYEEYSCVFTLYDFTKELKDLCKIPSEFDENVDLREFYIPLIDFLISALGKYFFGTENSTFSRSASEAHDVYIGNNHH